MLKKIVLISLASLVLGGCTLLPQNEEAATDTNVAAPSPSISPSLPPSDVNEISVYEKSQTTSSGSDLDSLEKDLNATMIEDEDLSDIFSD